MARRHEKEGETVGCMLYVVILGYTIPMGSTQLKGQRRLTLLSYVQFEIQLHCGFVYDISRMPELQRNKAETNSLRDDLYVPKSNQ
jgi:hypothetical protein